ncbi:hypothetical protein KCU59_g205, partial [Aureobasidium melanogenum]
MVYTLVVHLYAKDDQECINKLIAKLQEASQVYTNDKECLGWFVMQDTKDPRAFTIVERYAHESVSAIFTFSKYPNASQSFLLRHISSSNLKKILHPSFSFHRLLTNTLSLKQSQKYHLENPYWQTFDKYVIPLLAKDMDLRRLNELVDEKSEQVRVEQDPKLWEEVKKHQTY